MIKTESTCKKNLKLFLREYKNYLKSSLKKEKSKNSRLQKYTTLSVPHNILLCIIILKELLANLQKGVVTEK